MALPVIFLALLLLQSALSVTDDSFDGFDLFNPEDVESDVESYFDRQARNGDKFLRFGKAFWDYDSGNDAPFDDREVQRPSRTGSLMGNPQQRTVRDKYLRFGRSIHEESKKKRDKREAASSSEALKRHENYLRFGRNSNSNFMRFGRNLGLPVHNHIFGEEVMRQNLDSRNKHLLNYLKNLLRQSEESIRHKNDA